MSFSYAHKRGFMLVQLLVVVVIIGILAAVVLANMNEAKKKTRDTQRVSDLQQVQTAVRVYRDLNSTSVLPAATAGELYTSTSVLGTVVSSYISGTIRDPLNTGTNKYYYDSDYMCNGSSHAVILALTMERSSAANYTSVCGATVSNMGNGVTPSASSYIVILK